MSDIGATIIDSLRSALPDANAQVRYAGENDDLNGTVEEAVCTGIERTGTTSEQGSYDITTGTVRFKKSLEPTAWGTDIAIIGQMVEVLLAGETDWDEAVRVRVNNRLVMAGAVRLTVIGEFDEI